MAVRRRSLWFAGVLGFALVGVATGQEAKQPAGKDGKAPDAHRGLPHGAVARLGQTRLRHAEKPTCVAFAPDGKTFITGAEDGSVRVWSVATGDQLNIHQKPGMGVTALKFTHGGKRLAVQFGGDALIRSFDAATLKELGATPFINRHHFAFSQDGKYLATSDLAGNALVTEVATDLPKVELANASYFDFRPDGKAIAVGDGKGNVKVHLLTGGKPVFSARQDGAITGLSYSPDGTRLAVGSRAGNGTEVICVYKGKDEKPVAEVAGANIPQAWVGSDSLGCGNANEAGVYDLAQKKWASIVKGIAGEFAISPDGTKLAATGSGLRVRLWDLTTSKQMHAENDSFPDPALLAPSADGKTIFMLTTDAAYHWAIGAEGAKAAGKLPARAVTAASGGDKLVVATPDAVIVYAKFDPAKPLPEKPTHTFKDSAGTRALAVSADGSRLAWAADGGKVFVADPAGKTRRALPVTTTTILALGFSPNGERLGVLGRDPYLRVWDVSDERDDVKEVWKARIQRGQRGVVAFSPDGKLVTAVSTTQLLVFDATDAKGDDLREPLHRYERYTENGPVQHAAFTPDSRLLVVGSGGNYGRVEMWEVATHSLVRTFVTGYGGTSRLTVFPDGRRAASAGAEEAITVWDLTLRGDKGAPKEDELLSAWKGLESEDAGVGQYAVKTFSAGGNRGVEVLGRALKDIVANERKIKSWVEDLGSETFSIREIATRELLAQGVRALPTVTLAAKSDDPEIRDRATEVLKKLNAKDIRIPSHGLAGDTLRLYRAVQALEAIGTAEAKSVLQTIADLGGKPGDEAKVALSRLKKK